MSIFLEFTKVLKKSIKLDSPEYIQVSSKLAENPLHINYLENKMGRVHYSRNRKTNTRPDSIRTKVIQSMDCSTEINGQPRRREVYCMKVSKRRDPQRGSCGDQVLNKFSNQSSSQMGRILTSMRKSLDSDFLESTATFEQSKLIKSATKPKKSMKKQYMIKDKITNPKQKTLNPDIYLQLSTSSDSQSSSKNQKCLDNYIGISEKKFQRKKKKSLMKIFQKRS